MENIKRFTGENEAAIWQQVADDMVQEGQFFRYTAILSQQGQDTLMDIDIDLGGGFESGISITTFRTPLRQPVSLRFNMHEQDFLNEIGKVLGMEDIKLGYPDFDAAFIIQTNQPETLKSLFADERIRELLLQHPKAKLKLSAEDESPTAEAYLTFTLDKGIVDLNKLRAIYQLLRSLVHGIVEP